MKALETAAYYDEAGKMQRLKEQFSDENGVLNIRALPYGKYLLVETTVPEGKVAAAPKVLNVDSDETATAKGHCRWDLPSGISRRPVILKS